MELKSRFNPIFKRGGGGVEISGGGGGKVVVEIIGPEVSSGGAVTGFQFRIESSPRDQKFLPLDNNFEEFINALRSVKSGDLYSAAGNEETFLLEKV